MKTMIPFLITLGFCSIQPAQAQCDINPFMTRSFEFNGANYEIVLEKRNWQDAANCSAFRGGKLAEINSQEEQNAVFSALMDFFIDPAETVAPDGGNSSYLWLGGNDSSSEGNWVWNGDNDTETAPFWIGTSSGAPVNGSYENWGNEPDNWNNQDGLAMALTDWPLGQSGQWNDIFLSNELFFIIEYPAQSLGMSEKKQSGFQMWPNPAKQQLTVSFPENESPFILTDLSGKTLLSVIVSGIQMIDLSGISPGTYLVHSEQVTEKLVIE